MYYHTTIEELTRKGIVVCRGRLRQNSKLTPQAWLKINLKKVKKTLDKIEKVCYNTHYIGYDVKEV